MAGGSNLPDGDANDTRGNQDDTGTTAPPFDGTRSCSRRKHRSDRDVSHWLSRGADTPYRRNIGCVALPSSAPSRKVDDGGNVAPADGGGRTYRENGGSVTNGLHKGRLRNPLPLGRQRLRQRLRGKTRSRGCLKLGAPFSHARLADSTTGERQRRVVKFGRNA